MSEPKPKKKGKRLAPAIRENVMAEIAVMPPGQETADQIGMKWGVDPASVRRLMRSHNEIADLRQAAAARMLQISIRAQDRLMEDLDSEEVMIKCSPKYKSTIVKNSADAAVTLIEGIPQTTNVINFGDLKKQMKVLESFRQSKTITV